MGRYRNERLNQQAAVMTERANAFTSALAHQLACNGHTVKEETNVDGLVCIREIDGQAVLYIMKFQEQGGSRSWGYDLKFTGKLTLTMDNRGVRQAYKEPKKGFDINKTEERLLDQLNFRKAQEERRNRRDSRIAANQEMRKEMETAFNDALGVYEANIQVCNSSGEPLKQPEVRVEMNVEEAKAVAALLKEMRAKSEGESDTTPVPLPGFNQEDILPGFGPNDHGH